MKQYNLLSEENSVAKEIKRLREKSLMHKKPFSKDELNKPVSYWTKKERLKDQIGKEFTIILRTKGCKWALENGGCSMCGYIEDANIEEVDAEQIMNQFDYALTNTINSIRSDTNNYILKIFNSGSFLDESEISKPVREYIYRKIAEIPENTELSMESRVEFITQEKLDEFHKYLPNKYVEIGMGLESVNDYIRNRYINKGLKYEDFLEKLNLCHHNNVGSKVYLLFKPPFLNEQAAIDDCVNSIKKLIELNVNTISINPCNVQKGTLVEYLWHSHRYRPPWFYSLFECFNRALMEEDLKKTRILCDPSGAGTKRGIHNCLRSSCNDKMKTYLRHFILDQDLSKIHQIEYDCVCRKKYLMQIVYI